MATVSINCHFALVLIWHGIWLSECNNIGYLRTPTAITMDPPTPTVMSETASPLSMATSPTSNHTGVPAAESKVFISDVPGTTRWVTGHIVLEPRGCGVNQREAVEETANNARCLCAQNGGFFGTRTGECLGNVVSDGVQVRDSRGEQNAQFGIRRDVTLFFGYRSDEANPIVQLVSGVVWLLRDSQVYINQSIDAECARRQVATEGY
ncbi:N-acetylglucosamine-1-phosphodiester alpha-N-acetylglucosaminidase-like [Oncorhynchus keta]|uniref:N-acetylglucosamine-1-phosphodiester alpha-N-acetylglucosaminidase-like n=1 Tax=Oncorhynchus keta TaxID=8018 RepID=UPI00227D4BD9|nr:N-acetylglucosamine-1-phosphodiester alpha-N-acetylglucosaminidase-like [Oncorhynchus keta]